MHKLGLPQENCSVLSPSYSKLKPVSQKLLRIYPHSSFEAINVSLILFDVLQKLEDSYSDFPSGLLIISYQGS